MSEKANTQSKDAIANRLDAESLAGRGSLRHHVDPRIAANYIASGERLGDALIGFFAGAADLYDRLRHMLRPEPKRAMPAAHR